MEKEFKERLETWLKTIAASETIPEEIRGLNFGIFVPAASPDEEADHDSDEDKGYCIYLSGAEEYDPDDDDWACDMDYEVDEENQYLYFTGAPWNKMGWEEFLNLTVNTLKEIVENGEEDIKAYLGECHITAGFDEGTLEPVR